MTPSPVELLIVRALADHAEEAMSQTDTETQLQDVLSVGDEVVHRGRTWAVGGLVAAALAVAAVVQWPMGGQPPDASVPPADSARSAKPMSADERLAHDFTSAYYSFDRRLTASYIADGVTPALRSPLGKNGWVRQNRLEEALGTDARVDGCFEISAVAPDAVRIGCLFTFNLLGLEEFGVGPFSDELFTVTVSDGQVVDFFTAAGANDYEEEAWAPFWSWIEDTHPAEIPTLQLMDRSDLTEREVDRVIRHWKKIGQDYVAALRSGEVSPGLG